MTAFPDAPEAEAQRIRAHAGEVSHVLFDQLLAIGVDAALLQPDIAGRQASAASFANSAFEVRQHMTPRG